MICWKWMMNWKNWKKIWWPNLRHYSSICLEGRTKITDNVSEYSQCLVVIETGDLSNTSHEPYRFRQVAWFWSWGQSAFLRNSGIYTQDSTVWAFTAVKVHRTGHSSWPLLSTQCPDSSATAHALTWFCTHGVSRKSRTPLSSSRGTSRLSGIYPIQRCSIFLWFWFSVLLMPGSGLAQSV
jgi:hypothetical protein